MYPRAGQAAQLEAVGRIGGLLAGGSIPVYDLAIRHYGIKNLELEICPQFSLLVGETGQSLLTPVDIHVVAWPMTRALP